ncbi:MAG TPA: hypothetical protein VJ742_12460 [Nitrososphaera sp.]|nr:hypothetical protein [Nitrososphaera sp.]
MSKHKKLKSPEEPTTKFYSTNPYGFYSSHSTATPYYSGPLKPLDVKIDFSTVPKDLPEITIGYPSTYSTSWSSTGTGYSTKSLMPKIKTSYHTPKYKLATDFYTNAMEKLDEKDTEKEEVTETAPEQLKKMSSSPFPYALAGIAFVAGVIAASVFRILT